MHTIKKELQWLHFIYIENHIQYIFMKTLWGDGIITILLQKMEIRISVAKFCVFVFLHCLFTHEILQTDYWKYVFKRKFWRFTKLDLVTVWVWNYYYYIFFFTWWTRNLEFDSTARRILRLLGHGCTYEYFLLNFQKLWAVQSVDFTDFCSRMCFLFQKFLHETKLIANT